jgi:maltooligosyltrehalose trehalohydrolase
VSGDAARTVWAPAIGAVPDAGGTTVRVWCPTTRTVDLVVEDGGRADRRPLTREAGGLFTGRWSDLGPGTRYRYRLDGDGPFPDPASRWQPDGVHGASVVVDATAFPWTDRAWRGVPLSSLVVYELHVGTFTPAGTFAAAAERLPALAALGVTAVELMPVAAFPGRRNWGYDGVAPFAPAAAYGAPDDLRRLVDAAHGAGLAVLLDVVYNHLGPDGAYLNRFSPYYFTARHSSPWGAGIDLDGEHSAQSRRYFLENALHWIHEYHVDGLRLDATHAIHDDSATHFLAELAAQVHQSVSDRQIHVIAEDDRNLARVVQPPPAGGWGLDAVWADDLHHQLRRLLAGDDEGYYRDYTGTTADVAATIRQGWFFTGQHAAHWGKPRGTDPAGVPPRRCIVCLQNHDQIGNRPFGDRLHHRIDGAAFRAASVLLLGLPQTPLIFMGQEWAASTPFCYFTDHVEPLGRLVTEGRRREFAAFAAFGDPDTRELIPDPQAEETFRASRLRWEERDTEPHASTLRLHQAMLRLRAGALAPATGRDAATACAVDAATIALQRAGRDGGTYLIVARLRGHGPVELAATGIDGRLDGWRPVLTTEDPAHCPDPAPLVLVGSGRTATLDFRRPGAIVLRRAAVPGHDEA